MLVIQVRGVGTNHDSGISCFRAEHGPQEHSGASKVLACHCHYHDKLGLHGLKLQISHCPPQPPSPHGPTSFLWPLSRGYNLETDLEAWKCSFPSRCLFPNRSLILFFFRFWLPNVIYNKMQDYRGDTSKATNRCMTVLLTVARNSFSL